MSLLHTAVHALKWSVLAELVSRTVGAVVLLVLARLLVPEDFGVVAAATVVMSLSQLFTEAGLDKALIQRQTRVEDSANVVFWVNVAIGLLMAGALFAAAPLIAGFFRDERIAAVVRVLSLQMPLTALSSVQTALLRRDFGFRRLFWIRLTATGAGAVVSIPLAVAGMGYWALVAGTLCGQAGQTVVLWVQSAWRPHRGIDATLARELVGFGKWAMLSGLLGWFYGWMDAVVVGHYLGARDLGLYRTGSTFVSMVFGLVFWPLLPVLYSMIVRAQENLVAVREALRTVTHAIAAVALPIGAYLCVASDGIAEVIFGAGWSGVAIVIAMIGVKDALAWIVGANGEFYRAIGRPQVDTWVSAAMLLVYLAGYLVAIRHGLLAFLQIRIVLATIAITAHLLVARAVIGVPIRSWLYWRVMLVSIMSMLIAYAVRPDTGHAIFDLVLRTIVFFMVALGGMVALERGFLRHIGHLLYASRKP